MKFRYSAMLAAAALSAVLVAGCGASTNQQSADVAVNAYKISTSDTNIPESFSGSVVAQDSVAVHARVSGYVVEKYVKGGDQVVAGQPLYKIDARQYQANLAQAQAQAANANAAYQNAQVDLNRYQALASQDAIAQQTVDTQESATEQARASYEAYQAQVQIAQDNLDDTVVYAPYSGVLEMDAVDLGTFVTAGSTTLVTIDSMDPAYVQFSLSEQEYLEFMKQQGGNADGQLQLQLADGSIYEHTGHLVQAAKTLENGTGKLILKASFPNPDNKLLPNMFGTIISPGSVQKNAILIPSRAIQQVMDKKFVFVVQTDGTVKQVPIETGATKGAYTIIKGGLSAGEEIVVDGLTKIRDGVKVNAKLLDKQQVDATN
ncbi:MAG: efflux RND transporter periplasmic adaptor subunit [Veillonella sp.]|nr:efflux RND transporter periplasmic adaptor subunit [Veillonella sp.]MCF0155842.1 efflux RND transporter periplasmic adaptor subunit [Veillonella sp.]